MNTLELYIEKGRKEGLEKGIEKGIEKGKEEKGFEVVENLITKLGLDDLQVAEIAKVSIDFVKKVRVALVKKR